MVDYHVFLRSGLTLQDALRKSRTDGIQYGITASTQTVKNDAQAQQWLASLSGKPAFSALYAANADWTRSISRKTAQQFNYVLADNYSSKTNGNPITNPQEFLDGLLDQTVDRLNTEPIDIYCSPGYLPANIRAQADQLWTERRMTRLIDALLKNQVAVEINTNAQLPSRAFLENAKQAGCKFAFGTANETAADLKRCEYGLQMVEACKLDWHNFFAPGAWWPKAVERRWPA